jgi:hypothetical protein
LCVFTENGGFLPIHGDLDIKVNLKAKMKLLVNSTSQRCPNEIIKTFMIKDFFHLPPVSMTPVLHLDLRISPKFSKKFETALTVYSGAWGKLIQENPEVENLVTLSL